MQLRKMKQLAKRVSRGRVKRSRILTLSRFGFCYWLSNNKLRLRTLTMIFAARQAANAIRPFEHTL